MEQSHLPRSTDAHHYEQHYNPAGLHPEGEDETHHEKTSVLQKVKAKAKKIKNTLTKHGHDHDQDEDEEMVGDPGIHGAPSPIGPPRANLERPSVVAEDRYDPKMTDPPVRPLQEEDYGEPKGKLGELTATDEVHHVPDPKMTNPPVRPLPEEDYGEPKGKLGGLTATEEVHHVPDDKHVSFSTGNHDIGIHNPTEKNVYGKEESLGQERNKIGFPTAVEGIHGSTGKNIIGQEQNLGGQMGRIGMDTSMEEHPHGPNVRDVPTHVQAKATNPTGRGSDEVAGITPILSSFDKMGIDDNPEQKPKAGENLYTGSHDQFGPEPLGHENPDSIPKNCNPNNPQDLPLNTLSGNPSNQTSTYTERLTSAASSIADTAKSAKNVVASKLGYSGNESTGAPHQELHGQGDSTKPASTTDYAHKIAATVTETFAPVYGKVAGAGSTIVSKVQGSGTRTDNEGQGKGKVAGAGSTIVSKVQGSGTRTDNEGQDKGVSVKVKEYLAEKLKPGEEDKALSEMITGSFNKDKAEMEKKTKVGEGVSSGGGRGVSEVIKDDALHKREPEGSGDRKPMGKVTESEEVAKRLGTGGEDEVAEVAKRLGTGGEEGGGGKGVVDRVKGVFGSWLGGKGGDTQTTTPGTTYAGDNDHGEKKASGVE